VWWSTTEWSATWYEHSFISLGLYGVIYSFISHGKRIIALCLFILDAKSTIQGRAEASNDEIGVCFMSVVVDHRVVCDASFRAIQPIVSAMVSTFWTQKHHLLTTSRSFEPAREYRYDARSIRRNPGKIKAIPATIPPKRPAATDSLCYGEHFLDPKTSPTDDE
jgi:hypothetical protein